jgi:hypothetical protein
VVLAKPLDHPGVLLGYDLDGPGHKNDGNDEKKNGDFHAVSLLG